jgi:hypothetical protein
MNPINPSLETCRQLISELRWTKRHAEQSVRIAVSKAVWLGLERDEFLRLIRSLPIATLLHQRPHIVTETWVAIAQPSRPEEQLNEFDQAVCEQD